ncbi:hypothetical protein MTR67_023838 [Solanum verrucosum]|uniref:Uncharacterized protein n=1 Tax=Solanum verrucosum TaxID=315347 RepID=A0AAF0QXZ6_SOLVR|nr:hypothetical protein MTR67_023838 [Solanum verrucosum]
MVLECRRCPWCRLWT